jgi:hypothetical protein
MRQQINHSIQLQMEAVSVAMKAISTINNCDRMYKWSNHQQQLEAKVPEVVGRGGGSLPLVGSTFLRSRPCADDHNKVGGEPTCD